MGDPPQFSVVIHTRKYFGSTIVSFMHTFEQVKYISVEVYLIHSFYGYASFYKYGTSSQSIN